MKVLLFDIDATLLLSGHAGARAINRAFEQLYGLEQAMDGIRPDGKTDTLIFREIMTKRLPDICPDTEIPRAGKAYLSLLGEEVRDSPGFCLMPGVTELLEALSRVPGIALGLATGNLEEGARIKLQRAGLEAYFHFGGFGSDAEDRTELIRKAVQRAEEYLGKPVSREDIYVIGDTPRDIVHAQKAGVKVVAVATGRSDTEELGEYGPDYLLEDLSATGEVLKIFLEE